MTTLRKFKQANAHAESVGEHSAFDPVALDDVTLEALWVATLAMDQDVHVDPKEEVWDRLAEVHAALNAEMDKRAGY